MHGPESSGAAQTLSRASTSAVQVDLAGPVGCGEGQGGRRWRPFRESSAPRAANLSIPLGGADSEQEEDHQPNRPGHHQPTALPGLPRTPQAWLAVRSLGGRHPGHDLIHPILDLTLLDGRQPANGQIVSRCICRAAPHSSPGRLNWTTYTRSASRWSRNPASALTPPNATRPTETMAARQASNRRKETPKVQQVVADRRARAVARGTPSVSAFRQDRVSSNAHDHHESDERIADPRCGSDLRKIGSVERPPQPQGGASREAGVPG